MWRSKAFLVGYVEGYRETIREQPVDHEGVGEQWRLGHEQGQLDADTDKLIAKTGNPRATGITQLGSIPQPPRK